MILLFRTTADCKLTTVDGDRPPPDLIGEVEPQSDINLFSLVD